MHRFSRAVGLVALLVVSFTGGLAAQGVTSAALYGMVRSADSGGIGEAVVTVTNTSDGGYAVEAHAIGFRPAGERGIALSLGERRRVDVVLVPAVTQLAEVTVPAPETRLNGNRTGPAQTFTGAQAAALPLAHRDFSPSLPSQRHRDPRGAVR